MSAVSLVVLLHGTFVDDVLIEIVLPLLTFWGLYWWSSRKDKKKNKEEAAAPDAAAGRDEKEDA